MEVEDKIENLGFSSHLCPIFNRRCGGFECSAVVFINDLEGGATEAQAIVQAGAKR